MSAQSKVPSWITAPPCPPVDLETAIDPRRRVVRLRYRGPLDVVSSMVDLPFAELKVLAATVIQHEAEHEMVDRQRRG